MFGQCDYAEMDWYCEKPKGHDGPHGMIVYPEDHDLRQRGEEMFKRALGQQGAVRMDEVICVYCGRRGTRGFVHVSGNGDGSNDQYGCASRTACQRRQDSHPLPSDNQRSRVTIDLGPE